MVPRFAARLVKERLHQFPAVALVGPRQSGKTTLAKWLSTTYFDLEQEAERVRLDLRWEEVVKSGELVILDEAQAWPEVFPRLRGTIDSNRKANGRFLLLGSIAPALMKEISESLAGRLAVVELPPLTAIELPSGYQDALWRCGGFPDGGVLDAASGTFPVWQESYLKQMAQRDLPAWGLPAKPGETERLLRLVAAMNGAHANASQLGQSLGISYHTVQSYLDYLEGAFLIRRLYPFFANNITKRLTKTPKIYWRDTGLLHALLGLQASGDIFGQRWAGESWEGWVVEQILSVRQAAGESCHAFYFRTSDGLECDLVIEFGDEREIIEIKMTSEPSMEDFRKLAKIAALTGATRQVLLSRVSDEKSVMSGDRWSTNLYQYLSRYQQRAGLPSLPSPETITVPLLYERLKDAAGALKEHGILTEQTLLHRARCLKEDLDELAWAEFSILPTQWVENSANGLIIPFVEYSFGKTQHDINPAGPEAPPKAIHMATGSGLDHGDLLHFSKVSAAAHKIIPHLWLKDSRLRERLRDSHQHLAALNEVWWLSRWEGLDSGSIQMEFAMPPKPGEALSGTRPTVDWRFTVLGGAVTINLEVKNLIGTQGVILFDKSLRLFAGEPEKKFQPSGDDEINVLAITAYHGGIVAREEAEMVRAWLDGLKPPVVDAVLVNVAPAGNGNVNYEDHLYFPQNRNLNKKDLILKSLLRKPDKEDQSRVRLLKFPKPLERVLREIGWDSSEPKP
jgi:predicted AAA+ superfamily ATPase